MQKDINAYSFIRPTSKRSQTLTQLSTIHINIVPTIRLKNSDVVFSPLLLFSTFSEEPVLNNFILNKDLPSKAISSKAIFPTVFDNEFSSTCNSNSTSSTSHPTCLTPQLKKRDTILNKLKKRKE